MRQYIAAVLLMIISVPFFVSAQMEIPPIVDEVMISSETAELSLGVPEGWDTSVTESPTPYAVLSNLSNNPPVSVQMILRPANQLEVQFDTESLNPALDYYEKYASARGLKKEGAYANPVAVRDGSQRAALMLYVEQTTTPRFQEHEPVLSLSFATMTGDNELAIILFEAPAENWVDLLAVANVLLGTIQLNGQPFEFEEDVAQILIGFESAESLVERFESGNTLPAGALTVNPAQTGEPMTLRFIQNGVVAFAPPEWVVLADDDVLSVTAQSPDETATITLRVSMLPEEYVSVLALLSEQEDISKTVLFTWDTLLAAAGKIDAEDVTGALVVAELPSNGGLLWVRYETTSEKSNQTWLDFLTQIQVNNETLQFDEVWGAMFQLEQ